MGTNNILPVGTKVYHYELGCLEVVNYRNDIRLYTAKNDIGAIEFYKSGIIYPAGVNKKPLISLTEYDFVSGGFTPLEDYWKAKEGDFGFFWNKKTDGQPSEWCTIGRIVKIENNGYFFNGCYWYFFSREMPEHIQKLLQQ